MCCNAPEPLSFPLPVLFARSCQTDIFYAHEHQIIHANTLTHVYSLISTTMSIED